MGGGLGGRSRKMSGGAASTVTACSRMSNGGPSAVGLRISSIVSGYNHKNIH